MYLTKDFFISYGRRESLGFVARLHRAFLLKGYTDWFDKINIPDGEAYDKRISNGIESADNFVFVMAPRSLTSPYCLIELEYARVLGKRFITLLVRETEPSDITDTLRVINWIDFSGTDFDRPLAELIKEIELDRDHAHKHTLFQQRALEREENDRSPDFLFNGTATESALSWLSGSDGKKPAPTQRQRTHIWESEAAIEAAQRAARKRQRTIIGVVSLAAILSLGFGVLGFVKMNEANRNLRAAKLYSKRANDARVTANEKRREAERALNDLKTEKANKLIRRAENLINSNGFFYAKANLIEADSLTQDITGVSTMSKKIEPLMEECNRALGEP